MRALAATGSCAPRARASSSARCAGHSRAAVSGAGSRRKAASSGGHRVASGRRRPGREAVRPHHPQLDAAAAQRRQQAQRPPAEQQQDIACLRLLQHLEQGVGGGRVHRLGRFDDTDAAGRMVRPQRQGGDQVANRLDPDLLRGLARGLLVGLGRAQPEQVRVVADMQQLAGRATAAGRSAGGRCIAQQARRQHLGQTLAPLAAAPPSSRACGTRLPPCEQPRGVLGQPVRQRCRRVDGAPEQAVAAVAGNHPSRPSTMRNACADLVQRQAGIDHGEASGLGRNEVEVALPDAVEERLLLALETVRRLESGEPGAADRRRHIEQDGECRPRAGLDPRRQPAQQVEVECRDRHPGRPGWRR
jgi:hypothetical protein